MEPVGALSGRGQSHTRAGGPIMLRGAVRTPRTWAQEENTGVGSKTWGRIGPRRGCDRTRRARSCRAAPAAPREDRCMSSAGDNRQVVLLKSLATNNRFYTLVPPDSGMKNADAIE